MNFPCDFHGNEHLHVRKNIYVVKGSFSLHLHNFNASKYFTLKVVNLHTFTQTRQFDK